MSLSLERNSLLIPEGKSDYFKVIYNGNGTVDEKLVADWDLPSSYYLSSKVTSRSRKFSPGDSVIFTLILKMIRML